MATKLQNKVVRVLREAFPDVRDFFEPTESGIVTGVVVSGKFARKEYSTRQRILQRTLKKGLTAREYESVGTIAALTPAEAEIPA